MRFKVVILPSYIFIASAILLPAASLSAADVDCSKFVIKVDGANADECRKSAETYSDETKYGDCVGHTDWMMDWATQETECDRRSMDALLNVRLLKLKADSSDSALLQFKKEMVLQKFFLDAVRVQCRKEYGTCEGTVWGPVRAGCPGEWFALRAKQAELMNRHQLAFPSPTKLMGRRATVSNPYRKFAAALCEMPSDVWAGGKAPENCADRVLSNLNVSAGTCD